MKNLQSVISFQNQYHSVVQRYRVRFPVKKGDVSIFKSAQTGCDTRPSSYSGGLFVTLPRSLSGWGVKLIAELNVFFIVYCKFTIYSQRSNKQM
jgi:hypothetical protein